MALSRIDAYEPGCALAVANLAISDTRWAILDELVRIRALGCRVRVAFSSIAGPAYVQLWQAGIEIRYAQKPEIHSKMMLYKGRYDGEPGRTFVWGGSHNWTMGSLRKRDEVFVAISRLGIYLNYKKYFDHIWAVSWQ
jgi:phosphatidylserine/phosphatidylglycerophosphate/cardiolipin synthase-like enzyme